MCRDHPATSFESRAAGAGHGRIPAALETVQPLLAEQRHETRARDADPTLEIEALTAFDAGVGNLLNNAPNTPDPDGRITLTTRRDNGSRAALKDTASGIPARAAARLSI